MILRAWRVVKENYAADAFSGEGAFKHGGRWNSPGLRAVYASESMALATLEILVSGAPLSLLSRFVKIAVEFDDSCVLPVPVLPDGWDGYPAGSATREIGDAWFRSNKSVVLRVPSAVIHGEFNYMINPLHPDAKNSLTIHKPNRFDFDNRLTGKN